MLQSVDHGAYRSPHISTHAYLTNAMGRNSPIRRICYLQQVKFYCFKATFFKVYLTSIRKFTFPTCVVGGFFCKFLHKIASFARAET